MCKNPYCPTPTGVTQRQLYFVAGGREAATPYPCGQCLHCRINKSRVWAHRLMLESRMHEYSTFLTLTYSDEFLPLVRAVPGSGAVSELSGPTLVPEHVTKFVKRLRRFFGRHYGKKLRYYAAGEYGEQTDRPHYHLIVFGLPVSVAETAVPSLWPYGFVSCAAVDDGLCRYVCKYIVKNINWTKGGTRIMPFARMSRGRERGQGIGGPAMEVVAKTIKEKMPIGESPLPIIRQLCYGKSSLPLGRYLTDILCEILHIGEDRRSLDRWEYQQQSIDDIGLDRIPSGFKSEPSYRIAWLDYLQEITRVQREQLEARYRAIGR